MSALTASFDDIVFEGRNQAYGAYQLRQEYQSRLGRAGGITLGLCALLLCGWAVWPAPLPKTETFTHQTVCPIDVKPHITIIEKPVVAPPAPAAPAAAPATPSRPVASIATQVMPDKQVTTVPSDLTQLTTPNEPTGPVASAGPVGLLEGGSPGGVPGGTDPDAAATEAAPAKPFEYVEKMPEFAGGQSALLRYLRDHLRYPSQALREGQEGRVFMSFVVGTDGNISSVEVIKGLGYGLDEEALRVVRQMPAWTPGYQAHHAVPVRFTLPITFKLQ